MAEDLRIPSSMVLERFIERLIAQDPSGRAWLPGLLGAAPFAPDRLGELVERPGWLVTPMAVRTASGRLGCFEYPAIPPRGLLAWYIDHPQALEWPADADLSVETRRLRRALIDDDPRGSQPRAQERAHEQLQATRTLFGREWWRFETVDRLDCVLITDRLVITIEAPENDTLRPATDWYPVRSQLVRDLEAARLLAENRQWATLVLSSEPLAEGTSEALAGALTAGAPHLDAAARDELHAAYLGNLTWEDAARAVGLASVDLPVA